MKPEFTTKQERTKWQQHARHLLERGFKQVPTFHPDKVDRLITHLEAALGALESAMADLAKAEGSDPWYGASNQTLRLAIAVLEPQE